MTADKGKKAKIEGEANEQQIDGDLVLSIEKLQEIQDELEKVNEEASDKVLEVEQKYNEIRRPVYNKRTDIIKTIPDFWLTAFLSHPLLSELLLEEDQKIFKYLQSLDVEDNKDLKSGYSIILTFSENPYFEGTKLTKTYSFSEDGTTTINATAIKWKEGMNVANGGVPENKKGNKRQHPEEAQSFFTWFSETTQKDDPADAVQDEQVAEIIKEDLWPNPLKYFNNEVDEDEFEEGEGDEEEGSEGEDGEEEEEEE